MKQDTSPHGEVAVSNQPREKRLLRWIHGSMILSFLLFLTDKLYGWVRSSLFGAFFASYIPRDERLNRTLLPSISDKLHVHSGFVRPMRLRIAAGIDRCLCMSLLRRLGQRLASLPLYIYGLVCVSFGTSALLLQGVSYFFLQKSFLTQIEMLIAICAVIVSFPLFSSTKSTAYGIATGALCDLVLFRICGVKREFFAECKTVTGHPWLAICVGLFCGGACYFLPMKYGVLALAGIAAAVLVLSLPEIGIVATLFALPFLPTKLLCAAVLFVALSYFLKLLQGRRTLRFETLDFWVFLLMVLYVLGGLFSSNVALSLGPMCVIVCFMLGYFLIVNLIRTKDWLYRCFGAVMASAVLVSLYGIYQYIFGVADTTWQDTDMFSSIAGRVVSTFENPNVLGEFLVIAIPFFFAYFFTRRGFSRRVLSLLPMGICMLCLLFTWSRGAWLGLICGTLLFLLMYSKKSLTVLLFSVFGIPALPYVLPQNVLLRFSSIGNMADSSTSYRVYVWIGSLRMLRDHLFSGIGTGVNVFRTIYPRYSYSGVEVAPHSHSLYLQIVVELGLFGLFVFIAAMVAFSKSSFRNMRCSGGGKLKCWSAAGFCGIVSVLAQGATDYVWYNYRVLLWFWLVVGLVAACGRVIRAQSKTPDIENL